MHPDIDYLMYLLLVGGGLKAIGELIEKIVEIRRGNLDAKTPGYAATVHSGAPDTPDTPDRQDEK